MAQEWTEEQLAELEDPDYWNWDSVEFVRPDPNTPHGIRLGVDLDSAALAELLPAARASGVSLMEYVREAALSYTRTRAGTTAECPDPAR